MQLKVLQSTKCVISKFSCCVKSGLKEFKSSYLAQKKSMLNFKPRFKGLLLAGLLLITTAGADVYAQNRSGANYTIGFDYQLRFVAVELKNVNTNQLVDISAVVNTFKAKGGIFFADFNFLYFYLGIGAGGQDVVDVSLFAPAVPLTHLGYDVETLEIGIGYIAYILGKQNRNAINYYAGFEAGTISNKNKYGGGSLFDNSETDYSISNVDLIGGASYLLGSADFHLSLIFSSAAGPEGETVPNVKSSNIYTDTVDLSGLSLSFGILKYF